jgi:hypothetical protein
MTEIEITKYIKLSKCATFGNPESDVGTCVDCSVERDTIWNKCIEYRNQINRYVHKR